MAEQSEKITEKIGSKLASKPPSRDVIIGIALIAPILLGLLLRFYLLPNNEQANQNGVGNNALMLVGGEGNVQNINTPAQPETVSAPTSKDSTMSELNDSQIQIPKQLMGQ